MKDRNLTQAVEELIPEETELIEENKRESRACHIEKKNRWF